MTEESGKRKWYTNKIFLGLLGLGVAGGGIVGCDYLKARKEKSDRAQIIQQMLEARFNLKRNHQNLRGVSVGELQLLQTSFGLAGNKINLVVHNDGLIFQTKLNGFLGDIDVECTLGNDGSRQDYIRARDAGMRFWRNPSGQLVQIKLHGHEVMRLKPISLSSADGITTLPEITAGDKEPRVPRDEESWVGKAYYRTLVLNKHKGRWTDRQGRVYSDTDVGTCVYGIGDKREFQKMPVFLEFSSDFIRPVATTDLKAKGGAEK